MKKTKATVYPICVCISILFFFLSCTDPIEKLNSDVIGSWIQIEPFCDVQSGITCDTLIFSENNILTINDFQFGSYSIEQLDSISFISNTANEQTLKVLFYNDNLNLEIYSFENKIKGSGTVFAAKSVFEKI